ncbi:MAG: hypothetical protein GY835_17730 [bacterium]|nr:hypothetical protein [bacterium]
MLTILVALLLMPKLVGGMLDRGRQVAGGFAGEDWETTTILWDVGEVAEQTGPEIEEAPETEEEIEPEPEEEIPTDADPVIIEPSQQAGGGTVQPAGDPGEALEPATASEGSGGPVGDGRRSPRILYQEWPNQSMLAELDVAGTLFFRLRVEADGHVSAYELLRSFDCDECLTEAQRIIESLRFIPGTYAGRPVACWISYEIEFNMSSGR